MSPDAHFHDLRRLPSWAQHAAAARSLLIALELDNPEETLFCQLTISELSILTFALLIFSKIFPEFVGVASDLSAKLTQLSDAQNFLTNGEE